MYGHMPFHVNQEKGELSMSQTVVLALGNKTHHINAPRRPRFTILWVLLCLQMSIACHSAKSDKRSALSSLQIDLFERVLSVVCSQPHCFTPACERHYKDRLFAFALFTENIGYIMLSHSHATLLFQCH